MKREKRGFVFFASALHPRSTVAKTDGFIRFSSFASIDRGRGGIVILKLPHLPFISFRR
jgi:hypothetical protein